MHLIPFALDPNCQTGFPSFNLQLLLTKSNKVFMVYHNAKLINFLENTDKY